MKKRMMLQSTFEMRVRGVPVESRGRKNRTKEPPAKATRGSHDGDGETKNATETATVTPSVKKSPLRWRGGAEIIDADGVRAAERSLRNASQTRPMATAKQAA